MAGRQTTQRNFTLKGSRIKERELERDVGSRENFFKDENAYIGFCSEGVMQKMMVEGGE